MSERKVLIVDDDSHLLSGLTPRLKANGFSVVTAADAIAAICRGAARMVSVSEDAIAEAIRIYYDDTHQIAEGAGAAPLAALLQERERMANKCVAVILSGGNIERARFRQVLGGVTPSAA